MGAIRKAWQAPWLDTCYELACTGVGLHGVLVHVRLHRMVRCKTGDRREKNRAGARVMVGGTREVNAKHQATVNSMIGADWSSREGLSGNRERTSGGLDLGLACGAPLARGLSVMLHAYNCRQEHVE